jgi:hypothetical protein
MKKIFWILILAMTTFFASCGTTHKLKTSTHEKVDSISNVVKDTSSVTKSDVTTAGIKATGVDVEFDYGTDSTYNAGAVDSTPSKDPFVQIIKDAVAASGKTGRLPQKVKVHFDTFQDTTSHTIATDSSTGKTVSHTDLKKTVNDTSKTVTSHHMSAGLVIALVVLLIGSVVGVAWYFIKKYKLF